MTFSQLQVEIHNNTIGGRLLPSHDQAYPTCGVSLNKSLPDCTSSHDNSVWGISWRIRKPIISEFIPTRIISPTRKGRFRISKKCAKPQGSQQWAWPVGKGRIASSSDHKHHPQLHPNKQKTLQKYHRRPPSHEDVANGPKVPLTGEGQFRGYYMIIFWRWCESAPSKQKKDSLFYQVSSWEQSREGDGGRLPIVGSPRKNILYFNNNRKSPQVSPTIIRKCPSGSPLRSFPLPPPSYRRMSIANCPVLHPTWKEFKNFSQYVEKLDRLYKKNYGMVKVVPPPEWKPTSAAYHTKLHGLIVNGPIEQNIFGKGGVYQCLHIQKKSLSLKEYKEKMGVFDRITDDLSADQVEEMFWKNIVFSPPLYGADLLSTLMDQSAGPWNLSGLDSILRYAVNSNVRGVTTPYCYVGSWKTLFCWHKEDLDLSAINFLHEGKSKFWYSIPLDQSHILEREAKTFFPEHFSKCSQHLRHKTTLFNPYNLVKKYPNLKITKTEHRPGQFMLVFGGSYHCGFNFGFNIAEAVNYATLGWLPQLMNCKYCHCTKSSVRASFREILDNLTQSPFAHAREVAELRRVVEMSQEKEMEEEAKVDEIKGIRQQFSRKAKKEKKISKINYRGEEYHIDHWATCDKCGQWRKLQKKLRDGKPFRCDDLGKKCSLRDKVDKDYITL